MSGSLVLCFSCLRSRLPSGLVCCVRLPGLVFGLSPVLSPSLFPKQFTVGVLNAVLSVSTLAGLLCPPPWSCVSLVSGLVSHLVFQLFWNAASVVWACLKNFMCDLCNCLGSTVV